MPIVPLEVEVARTDVFRAPADKGPPPRVSPPPSAPEPAPPASAPAAPDAERSAPGVPPERSQSRDAASAEVQVASLPPARDASGNLVIPFAAGEAGIPDDAYQELRNVARPLLSDPDLRVQVLAFATGDEDGDTSARRTSLSRALAIRAYLIDAGIRSTRIDVRALGDTSDRGPVDRVEVVLSRS